MAIDWNSFAMPGSPLTYSPTETGPMSYLDDVYSSKHDYNMDDWVISDYLQDQQTSSAELPETLGSVNMPSIFPPKSHLIFNTSAQDAVQCSDTATINPYSAISSSSCFSQLSSISKYPYTSDLPFSNLRKEEFEYSPRDGASPTPSLCSDSCQLEELEELERSQSKEASHPASSGALHTPPGTSTLYHSYFDNNPSCTGDGIDNEQLFFPIIEDNEEFKGTETPTLSKQEPISTPPIKDLKIHIESSPSIPKRRGRPRTKCTYTGPGRPITNSRPKMQRTPHNEVERKYRLGLNAELDRLRRTIPTLLQQDLSSLSGPPRPSKAMVLASAVDYIKAVEKNVAELEAENVRLREVHLREAGKGSSGRKSLRNRK